MSEWLPGVSEEVVHPLASSPSEDNHRVAILDILTRYVGGAAAGGRGARSQEVREEEALLNQEYITKK